VEDIRTNRLDKRAPTPLIVGTMTAQPTSHFHPSQQLRLHYADWGNGGAPPLILLHGGNDHCRNWDQVAGALARDHHVIASDLRGHGDSDQSASGEYSVNAHVFDLAELVRTQDLAPVTIIGHSFGGKVALRYAGLYPEAVARLVSIEGHGAPPGWEAERQAVPIEQRIRTFFDLQRKRAAATPRRYATIEEAITRLSARHPHLSAELARHLTVHGTHRHADGSYGWKLDRRAGLMSPVDISTEDTHRLWGRIACPVLLVRGGDSPAPDPAEDGSLAHFQDAQAAVIAGAGHWVHHDRLDAFLELMRGFLG